MRVRSLVVVALLTLVSALSAQSVDPALTAAIAARDKATIDRDAATVAKYTADDYASINPNGARMTKQQRVDGLKVPAAPGAAPGSPVRTEALRMYGPNAAVARLKGNGNRQLHVWIKNPSGWQVTAIHVLPDVFMPPQPPVDRPATAEPSMTIAPAGLSGDAAAVFMAHKQIQDAFFAGDKALYSRMSAPEFVTLNPNLIRFADETGGNIDGKPRHQPKFSNITVQAWGQVGVVRWLESGTPTPARWITRVFAKAPAGWRQVATASSLAGNPPIAP